MPKAKRVALEQRVAELEAGMLMIAVLAGPSKPGRRPPMATRAIYNYAVEVMASPTCEKKAGKR